MQDAGPCHASDQCAKLWQASSLSAPASWFHIISCHLPPALTTPNSHLSCLNGVYVVSACGSDSTGPLGLRWASSYLPHLGRTCQGWENTESQWFSNCVQRSLGCWEGLGKRETEGCRWSQVPPPPLWELETEGGADGGVGGPTQHCPPVPGRRRDCAQHQGQLPTWLLRCALAAAGDFVLGPS